MSENVIEYPEKKWEFRALTAQDIFPIANLIGKIGIGSFVEKFADGGVAKAIEEGDADSVGMKVMVRGIETVLANLDSCEKDIYKILSSTSNLSEKEIKALSMGDFVEMIVDFIKKDDFADFFKQVSSLLG